MSRLIDKKEWKIEDSNSIIAFETAGGGHWAAWDRYLTIEGKKAFHIGNICGTCEFFFERLPGASTGVSPREISKTLEQGLTNLDNDLLSKVSAILPTGEYEVSLIEVTPKLVELGTKEDYFFNEQVQIWGIDGFWGLPHSPKVKYYRGLTKERILQSYLSSWSRLFLLIG
ncbi:hypothetical protein [Oceanobacillus sp. CAU 1775]